MNDITLMESFVQRLCTTPGLAGFEGGVRQLLSQEFRAQGLDPVTDALGNCMARIPGRDPSAPVTMIFAHMDSLGFVVRTIEEDGFLRLERLGGIPEKALPTTEVVVGCRDGSYVEGVIGMKAHHVTPPEEKYVVDKYTNLFVDIGATSRDEVLDLGIHVGSPIVYRPKYRRLQGTRVLASSLDDRGGCSALLFLAHRLRAGERAGDVWLVGTVLEEYNLRGAMVATRTVRPDVALCLDGGGACDTPDLKGAGHVRMGGGPTMDLYNFHGRGTLNGSMPHPAMVRLGLEVSEKAGIPLQRRAGIGVLTDLSYVQLEGTGIKGLDLGFPIRYSHGPCEIADLADLLALATVAEGIVNTIGPATDFSR